MDGFWLLRPIRSIDEVLFVLSCGKKPVVVYLVVCIKLFSGSGLPVDIAFWSASLERFSGDLIENFFLILLDVASEL